MIEGGIVGELESLKPKDKEPRNRSVLDSWIAHAEAAIDPERQGRLSWLVASTVAVAALQRVVDESGTSLFSLKGGTLLQHRLGLVSRATKDLDGIVRGDIDGFLGWMDEVLAEDWGPISFSRSEVEEIRVRAKLVNPRRFDLVLSIKGETWRKVAVEISPDEGGAASSQEIVPAPPLDRFGIPNVDGIVGMSMGYQIAQKIHAATDPHDPPEYVNNRPRDVVDLLLLKELCESTGSPSPKEIRSACEDIFAARAQEASALGRVPRSWPPVLNAHPHWSDDYCQAAASCGVETSLEDAVVAVSSWIQDISACG